MTAEICAFCPAPATPGSEYCEPCTNALADPGPLCAECGQPLTSEDIEAGETTCLDCAGLELLATLDMESPLLARVRVNFNQV